MSRKVFVIVAVVALFPLLAHAQTPKPLEMGTTKKATATIQGVSQSDRHVVLLLTDGSRMLVEAGPDVRNFDKVRPGDRVVVTYQEGVIAEVKPGSDSGEKPPPQAAQARTRSGPGAMPSESVSASIAATVTIESVDSSFDTVTFKAPDGLIRTMAVETPKAKEFIDQLKPGDKVQITYREAAAVSIEPARG